MAQPTMGAEYKIQVLDRAFAILDVLAASDASLSAADLGGRLGLNKTTAHRLLAVLERNRFVERDRESGRYRLGLKLVEMGGIALSRFDLHRLANPFVERLATETGETAHLGILRQSEVISLVNAEGRHSLRTPSTVGRRSPLHCTSLGKVLLAFLPQPAADTALRQYWFKAYTRQTIRSATQFRAELSRVRAAGFALDDEEFEDGLTCIGAPVRNHSAAVIAAISIAGPAFRIKGDRMAGLVRSVLQAAANLSASLGYQPDGAATTSRKRTA